MVDQEEVEAIFQPSLVVVARIHCFSVVAAEVLMVAALVVVEHFVRSARLRPAEGTERETAALVQLIAQPLSALFVVPKSHHLDQEERFANRNRQSLLDI